MTAVVPIFPTSTTRKVLENESRSIRYEDDERTNVTRLIIQRGSGFRVTEEKGRDPEGERK